jgi:hypothetical protein
MGNGAAYGVTEKSHCTSPARTLEPNTAVTLTGVVAPTVTPFGSKKAPAVPSTVWPASVRLAGAGIVTAQAPLLNVALGCVAC